MMMMSKQKDKTCVPVVPQATEEQRETLLLKAIGKHKETKINIMKDIQNIERYFYCSSKTETYDTSTSWTPIYTKLLTYSPKTGLIKFSHPTNDDSKEANVLFQIDYTTLDKNPQNQQELINLYFNILEEIEAN